MLKSISRLLVPLETFWGVGRKETKKKKKKSKTKKKESRNS